MTTVTDTDISAIKGLKPLADATTTATDLFRKAMTGDKSTGIISIDAEAYEKNLPPTLTKEMIVELQKYNTLVAAAVTNASGQLSLEMMTKNKALESTELVMPMIGKDTLSVTFKKQAEVSAGAGSDAGKKIIYGQTNVKIETYARGNRGELAKVKDHLSTAAKSLFT